MSRGLMTLCLCLSCLGLSCLGSMIPAALSAADEPARTEAIAPQATENRTGPPAGAAARDEAVRAESLWNLADPGAALWLELRDLKDWKKVRDSAWFQQLKSSPVFERWLGSGDYQAVKQAWIGAEKSLQTPLLPLIETLFGEQVLLVVRWDDREQLHGVLLTKGPNPESLQKLIAAWNRIEQARLTDVAHAGQTYQRRDTGSGTLYYALLGRSLCLSPDAAEIEQVLERARANAQPASSDLPVPDLKATEPKTTEPKTTDSKPDAPAKTGSKDAPGTAASGIDSTWERNFDQLTGRPTVRLLLNPRAWDKLLKLDPESVAQNEEARLGSQLWQQVDRLSAGLSLEQGPVLECLVRLSSEKTSPAWKSFARRSHGQPALWARFPDDTLVRMGGRIDLGLLSDLLPIDLPADKLRELTSLRRAAKGLCLGLDLLDDIVRLFEVNWGVCVVPAREERDGGWPVDLVMAWELPRSEAPARMGIGWKRGLENALLTGMNVWTVSVNSERTEGLAVMRVEERLGSTLQILDGIDGFRPVWGFGQGYLWLGTSPALVQEMLQSLSREIDPELQQRHSRVLVQYPCQQWLQINTRVGRNWLTGQKESLIASLSKSQHTPPEKIGQRIDRLVELLRMTDEIFAGVEIQPDHLRFVVGAAVPANAP